MIRLLVVLRNAYDRGALRNGWHPARWRKELLTSRTGRRLALAVPTGDGWTVRYANAAPGMGAGPDSALEACPRHLRRVLRHAEPSIVLACGETAREALQGLWTGPLVAIPHPAYRALSNFVLEHARWCLELYAQDRRTHRLQIFQKRGEVGIRLLT